MTKQISRRDFVKASSSTAALLASTPLVYAGGQEQTISVGLIGCGGRGTGAAENALAVKNGPVKLVAMADVFPAKLADSHGRLRQRFASQMDVPEDRKFIGFDAYRKALDCLKPGLAHEAGDRVDRFLSRPRGT
jgi:hypothetical protein